MFAGSIQGNRSGFATSLATRTFGAVVSSRSKLLIAILAAAMLASLGGIAMVNRAEIADLIVRGSKALGESASAVGNTPLARSMVALLGQRSPGERTQGDLVSDKRRYAEQPKQRALGKIRPALPAPFVKALTNPVADFAPAIVQNPLVPSLVPAAISSQSPVFVGGGGGGGGPGGGGGGGGAPGGGTPDGPPGAEVPPVVAPVPEPATWLTMILGFFLLTRALRNQRPVTVRRAAQAA